MSIHTSNLQLKVKDKSAMAYLAEPANGGPGILLIHAWWGLKPFFKQLCDRLAEQGFVALAPDLWNGQVAKTIEEAQELKEKEDTHLSGEVVKAAEDYLLGLPNRKGHKIGVIGFSMGGDWSLKVAAEIPDKVAATVLFYGAGQADFNKLKSKVLGHFSDVDEWEDYDYVQLMESKMKAAGVDVRFHIYPGLAHWFMEEDRPEYEPEAAKLAWQRTIDFLKTNL